MRKLEGWKAVVSVPSQRKAWEVYLLEVYYPDDPTRLCRPKAGQSLYVQMFTTTIKQCEIVHRWKNWLLTKNYHSCYYHHIKKE